MNCCGDKICGDFEQFYCQVLKLMPENEICKTGNFYKILRSIAQSFYDTLYDAPGGLCYLKKEADPMTADITIDLWMQIYGLDDNLSCEGGAIVNPDELKISRRSRLRAHEILKWFDGNDEDLLQLIADQFGLTIETFVPTYFIEDEYDCQSVSDECNQIYFDFESEKDCDSGRYEFEGDFFASNNNCGCNEKKFGIIIKNSPEPIYRKICDAYTNDNLCCNIWVDGFKQTIRKHFSQEIIFCEKWHINLYNSIPMVT